MWVRFDHLRDVVRDPALLGGNSQTVEKLRPLLDMIERVERMRPRADSSAEGTENADNQTRTDGPAGRETGQPRGPPIPGSSRQVETSPLERGPMDPRPYPPVLGTHPLGGMYQSAPIAGPYPSQAPSPPTRSCSMNPQLYRSQTHNRVLVSTFKIIPLTFIMRRKCIQIASYPILCRVLAPRFGFLPLTLPMSRRCIRQALHPLLCPIEMVPGATVPRTLRICGPKRI